MDKVFDVIILGAGPAGLAAGLYAGRSRMDTLILEKLAPGGQIAITDEIENYPGSIDHETGPSLVNRMAAQTEKFGVATVKDTVIGVELDGEIKCIEGVYGKYFAKAVIISTGLQHKRIGCPGERELTGKGVSYCATCDAAFFEGLEVFVVGGGDAAVEEALYLTKFARKVTIIHRRDQLRAVKSIQQKAFANDKLHFMWDTVIEELKGDGILGSIVVKNVKTGETNELFADEDDGTFGVFVFVGFDPMSSLFADKLEMMGGYIVTDDNMKTSIPGVYAAGDIRVKSLRQVVTAVADGAIAATQAERYLEGL
ncbi:MAG: thioredoxin-disulfide reductase [Eubacteriales bacterium]|jgi:thioredoxin reductase (NADPH)|nr:thioredoxin-disulfide reductase [Eubacteriales bacterium]